LDDDNGGCLGAPSGFCLPLNTRPRAQPQGMNRSYADTTQRALRLWQVSKPDGLRWHKDSLRFCAIHNINVCIRFGLWLWLANACWI